MHTCMQYKIAQTYIIYSILLTWNIISYVFQNHYTVYVAAKQISKSVSDVGIETSVLCTVDVFWRISNGSSSVPCR